MSMRRDTFLIRMLTIDDKKNCLHLMLEDTKSGYRAQIILLKDEGYTIPQIRKITNHHDNNIRKWIHRFNEKGIDGIMSKKYCHKQYKFDDDIEKKIVDITLSNPRSFGLGFSTWSLRVLAGFLMNDLKLVDKISHSELRNILLKHGIKWRKSKTVLSTALLHDSKISYNRSLFLTIVIEFSLFSFYPINKTFAKNEKNNHATEHFKDITICLYLTVDWL